MHGGGVLFKQTAKKVIFLRFAGLGASVFGRAHGQSHDRIIGEVTVRVKECEILELEIFPFKPGTDYIAHDRPIIFLCCFRSKRTPWPCVQAR